MVLSDPNEITKILEYHWSLFEDNMKPDDLRSSCLVYYALVIKDF